MATKTYTYTNGATADGGQVETDFNEIYTSIDWSNFSSSNAMVDIDQDFRFDNNVKISFENVAGSADCQIFETTSDNLRIKIGTATKTLELADSSDNIKFEIDTDNELVTIRDGYTLKIYNSDDTKAVTLLHDGGNAVLESTTGDIFLKAAGGDVQMDNTNLVIQDGKTMRIYNSAGTSYAQMVFTTDFQLSTSSGDIRFDSAGGSVRPATDNNENLGEGSYRWKEVFAVAGSINVSFSWTKKDIEKLDTKYCLDSIPEAINFRWIEWDTDERYMGYLADNLPKDALKYEEGKEKPVGVKESAVIGLLCGAVKELQKQIEELKK